MVLSEPVHICLFVCMYFPFYFANFEMTNIVQRVLVTVSINITQTTVIKRIISG
jgi:hypothetical protein